MSSTILVTGAAGFIGQAVCAQLKDKGCKVVGLDTNQPKHCDYWLKRSITTPIETFRGIDAVVHLAAVANPKDCDADPTLAFDVNVNGTYQVLQMALACGAKKFVFASTAHVYGISPKWLPTGEPHPLWLQNTYTLTKILGEQLCHLYFENHGLNYTVLRLYNVYGPGQSQGYFIPDMLAKQENTIELRVANTTKDFVYVDDVVRAILLTLESSFVGPVNIGSGIETPLCDVACQLIKDRTVICYNDDSATRMCADRMRAKVVLGWEPTVPLKEGLRACFEHAKAQPVPA